MNPVYQQPLVLTARWIIPIWGNSDWSALTGGPTPDLPPVGELWLNDDRPEGSYVAQGPLIGLSLAELVAEGSPELLGPIWAEKKRLPILLKFLNPSRWLSVQLHPDNDHAPAGELGKYEAWHILSARPEARIILGLKDGREADQVRRAAEAGDWQSILRRQPVAEGESFFIPAGTVHALGPGMLLFEIQQNSDVTFRFYDWDRLDDRGRPRQLHFEQACANLRGLDPARLKIAPLAINGPAGTREYLIACRRFCLTKLSLKAEARQQTDGRAAGFLTCLSGRAEVRASAGAVVLEAAQTALLPAALGDYSIRPQKGPAVLLESREPDLKADVLAPLTRAGFSRGRILSLAGPVGEEEFEGLG